MLAITIFDVMDGLRGKHFWTSKPDRPKGLDLNTAYYILDTDHVQLRPRQGPALFVYSRKNTPRGLLTWIGLYSALPSSLVKRPGDYFGVGSWFLSSRINGAETVNILRSALTSLHGRIEEAAHSARWRNENASLDDLGLDESEIDDSRDRPCNELFKVGGETVCLDLARRGGGLALSQTIDNLQDFDRLARYGKILISDDASVIDDIRKRSRLGITNLDKIEAMATRIDPQTGGKSLIATSRSRTQPESSVHGTSRMPSMTHDNATKMDLELAEERVDLHIKALTASVLLWKRIVVAGLALCLCFTLVLFAVMWRIQNVTIMGMPSTTEGVASKQSSDHQPEQTATGFITMGAPPNQTAGQSQPSGASIDPKPGGAPLVPSVTWRQMESSKVEKAQKDLDEIIRDLHDMVSGMNGKNREKLNHILDAATDGRNALN